MAQRYRAIQQVIRRVSLVIRIITNENNPSKTTDIKFPRDAFTHSILHGFAAYSVYYGAALEVGIIGANDVIGATSVQLPRATAPRLSKNQVVFDVPYELVELFMHRNMHR